MKYGKIKNFQTGVAIPISGLKTDQSCGIGEFFDLIPFAQWAKKTGMNIIQVLPINDSGSGSSPYSALSAFAINPIYIQLDELEGASKFSNEIRAFRESQKSFERIPYYSVYEFKQSLFKKIFQKQSAETLKALTPWIKKNSWVKNYAIYLDLKEKNNGQAWSEWEEYSEISDKELAALWKKNRKNLLFNVWLQYEAEKQFLKVVEELNLIDIKLKGDIPILINEDSVDVWANPQYFDASSKAGAPPDMFSKTGQNWGFPCYNWDTLKADDFSWWKERMQQCSKFFHAIRIDHVLGFFRIWQIPKHQESGILGSFYPAKAFSNSTLSQKFSGEQIRQFITPSFSQQQLDEILSGFELNWDDVFQWDNGIFYLRDDIVSESHIQSFARHNEALEKKLLEIYWNRLLVENKGEYQPYWFWYDSPSFHRLDHNNQESFRGLVHELEQSQDTLWAQTGTELLEMLKNASDMLVCAEDLGAIPPCVPTVLKDLDILSLKIERWAREWESPNQDFIDPKNYNRNSVCSPSCHDTTTLRGWWDEKGEDVLSYGSLINWSELPDFLTIELAEEIIKRNLCANSLVCIFPLQDWLSLSYDIRTYGSDEERINIPGTVTDFNWNWKMRPKINDLAENAVLNQKIFSLIQERQNRSL
jgi:4-alpha-glucanotransferase